MIKWFHWLIAVLLLGGAALLEEPTSPPVYVVLDEQNRSADRLVELSVQNYRGIVFPGTRVDVAAVEGNPSKSYFAVEDVLLRRFDYDHPTEVGRLPKPRIVLQVTLMQEQQIARASGNDAKFVLVLHPPDNPKQPE